MGLVLESLAAEYLSNSFQFPDDGLKKDIKNNPSWYKAVGDAMMSQYFNNSCVVPYLWGTKSRSISELRCYARGEQDVNKYKPLLCHNLNQDGGKAYLNISWSAVRSIPLFRNVIKGLALKTSYQISVDALDPSSLAEKQLEKAYWLLQTDPTWKEFSKEMASRGVKVPKSNFQSEQQVNLWAKAGGLKLATEIAMKVALEASLYLSKFEDSVKVQLIDDLIDIGMCWTRDYVESGTKYVKARYVDPEYYIGRFSQFLDHHNCDYGAELRLMTIGEIRAEAGLKESVLFQIARRWQTDFGNSMSRFAGYGMFNSAYADRYKTEYGCTVIDDFKVPVLDAVYVSSDVDYYTKVIREGSGNLIYNEVGQDYKLDEREKRKGKSLEGKTTENIYKFKYILGSDFVFDYGEDTDIAHDGPDGHKRAVLPYHGYKLGTSSIVDLLVPIEDDMCLTTYKWRNAKARMIPPPGLVIEKGVLENITVGGVKMTPKQATAMGMETGYMMIQSLTDHGKPGLGANSSPVTPMPNTALEHFNVYASDMASLWAQAHKITGINDLTAASQPDERQGKGVMQMSVQLSNNVIAPLFKGYEVVFEQTMRSCGLRWQNVLRNGDVNGYYRAIGSSNLEAFRLTKNVSFMDFGLIIESMPSEQEIEALLAEIGALKSQNLATGSGGISPESYLLIYREIKRGNIDLAMLMLTNAVQEQKMQDQQFALQREEMNGVIQQKSLQANITGQQAQLEQQWGYKQQELLLQAQIDKESDARKNEYALQQIAAKGNEAKEQKLIGSQTELTREIIKTKKTPSKSY